MAWLPSGSGAAWPLTLGKARRLSRPGHTRSRWTYARNLQGLPIEDDLQGNAISQAGPAPRRERGAAMNRFVVLEHRWQGVHWDLMFERGDVLCTWAIDR